MLRPLAADFQHDINLALRRDHQASNRRHTEIQAIITAKYQGIIKKDILAQVLLERPTFSLVNESESSRQAIPQTTMIPRKIK